MYIYSMKADSQPDADRLMRVLQELCPHQTVAVTKTVPAIMPFTDVAVEFQAPVNMRQMHEALAKVPNSEAMFETIQNCDLKYNKLERHGRRNPYIDELTP